MNAPSTAQPKIGFNDLLRFVLELFAIVTLGIFGFTAFPLPWPGVLIGIGAPLFAILLWALFRSPKAVFAVDPFVKALVEIAVFSSAAIAWWLMGQPIVAIAFAVVAAVSGVINGRREFSA
ncbi:YrdB family protein [Agromyces mediolanus]|uniref:YrdB family protein n=1 Tax=Agromyces mediolanus TaxID=41986 RepID=UPI00203E8D43|nr:YrdB family protein [Agromyces mediolanus]MCM3655778.1 YrdB family protein [Agromyces mediolanus]